MTDRSLTLYLVRVVPDTCTRRHDISLNVRIALFRRYGGLLLSVYEATWETARGVSSLGRRESVRNENVLLLQASSLHGNKDRPCNGHKQRGDHGLTSWITTPLHKLQSART